MILLRVLVLGVATLGIAAVPAPSRGVGDVRFHDFSSTVFGNRRQLRVLVPPGYDDSVNRARRYPVLYLNDGQNLFDSATSLFNPTEWRVDETMYDLIERGRIPPLIVVGIDNAGRRGRFHEYYPWVDVTLQPPDPDPQGDKYPRFLVDEVVPFIDARYRTSSDPKDRGVGGSSAGALAAIYAVAKRPGAFGRLLVESPSLYLDEYHVFREFTADVSKLQRVHLGVGTNESNAAPCPTDPEPHLVRDVRQFRDSLERQGLDPARIHLVVTRCGRHDEDAWAARFPAAIEFLFGKR